MADEAPPPQEAPAKPKKKLPLTLIIVLGVAIAEAGAFFAVFQYIGRGPAAAEAASSHAEGEPAEGEATAEKPAEHGGEAQAEGGHGEAKPAEAGGEAHGEKEGEHGAKDAAAKGSVTGLGEVLVVKNFRVPNNKSGRLFIYDIDLSIVVAASDKERLEKMVKERNAEIADTIAQIIRRASEKTLTEDDLRALRYQIKEGLLEIIKDEKLVQRVLIPRFVPIRAD